MAWAYARAAGRSDEMVTAVLLAITVVVAAAVVALAPHLGGRLVARELVLCAAAAAYFGLTWGALRTGAGRRATALRWLGATVEPAIVTVALWIVAHTNGAAWAAAAPAWALYAVVMAANVLRMDPRLCVYGGAVAVLGHLAVYFGAVAPGLTADDVARVPPLGAWGAWAGALWLSLVAAALAVATERMRRLAITGGSEVWRRQRLEAELSRFVSPDVAQAILRGDAVAGAAERREVTVLFCDLRDFTGLCERWAPEDVVALLNEFYEEACRLIRNHGGTVNKFLGDGLLALFGAPDEHPNHAQAAAEAAHEIVYAVDRLRERGGVWAHLDVGIGLDSGHVVCGAVGAQSRLEYTAIGSVVNRAARLQGLSKRANRRIVLSRDCVDRLGPRANVVALGEVPLKGFDDPVAVYAFRYS